MIRTRTWVLAALLALPVLIYVVAGAMALWQTGLLIWLWWMLPLCWLLVWLVARVWKAPPMAQAEKMTPLRHWTQRDTQAIQIVETYQRRIESYSMSQLTDLHFCLEQLKSLSLELARHYHPRATDPYSSLTAAELVAAVRLAIDDLEVWMLESAPGSRLLSIRQWKKLKDAPKWMRRLQNAAWAASILVNPKYAASYLSSRVTIDPVTSELQTELMMAVYLRFLRQVGFYLIEMNSGRLRGGADTYRRSFLPPDSQVGLQPAMPRQAASADANERGPEATEVVLALVGQVNSGKSSLINAIAGGVQAAVDILPTTREVQRVRYCLAPGAATLTLLDTPGYGESGASPGQQQQITQALEEADLVLLVLDAHQPARNADLNTWRGVLTYYQQSPQRRLPQALAVLTHCDVLPPSLIWDPPYDWQSPTTPKARQIHDAVDYARELFGQHVSDVVPVCSSPDPNRRWNIEAALLPALLASLDEARATALLRAFEQRLDADHWPALIRQLRRGGGELLKTWVEKHS